MMKPLPPVNVAGLLDRAANGDVDARPTLLRVLTDLYVQKDVHTDEEECQYTELALRLIDVVDMPARATTAATLANFPGAPYAVIQRLAHDSLMVAAPVLKHSPLLGSNELEVIAAECGLGHAAVIAKRERLKATAIDRIPVPFVAPGSMSELALAGHGIAPEIRVPELPAARIKPMMAAAAMEEDAPSGVPTVTSVIEGLKRAQAPEPIELAESIETAKPIEVVAPRETIKPSVDAPLRADLGADLAADLAADLGATLAPALLSDTAWPAVPDAPLTIELSPPHELTELFYGANAEDRRLILLNLNYVTPINLRPHLAVAQSAFDRLEMAALSHRHDQFAQDLVKLLDISRDQALRIMRDESGEPVVVAAKALGMPAAVLQRILLFVNPSVGESIERVYGLASLFAEMDRQAAEYMVSIWRATRPARSHGFGHQPLLVDGESVRGSGASTQRRLPAGGLAAARRSA